MPAISLSQAAGQAFDNLQVQWLADRLHQRIVLFCGTSMPFFEEQDPKQHPVINWLTVFWSFGTLLPLSGVPIQGLNTAAQYLYRTCWMTSFLQTAGQITTAQGNNVLANYNGQFT